MQPYAAPEGHTEQGGQYGQHRREELQALLDVDLDFDVQVTGFSIAEIDSLVDGVAPEEPGVPKDAKRDGVVIVLRDDELAPGPALGSDRPTDEEPVAARSGVLELPRIANDATSDHQA